MFFGYIFLVRSRDWRNLRQPLFVGRWHFGYVLWLVVAGIGWLLFATNLLYWGIVFVTSALDIGVYYLTLGMAKRALQDRAVVGAA